VPLLEYGENPNLFSAVSIIWGEERQENGQIKGIGLKYGRREEEDNGYRNARTR
jgi:hypothetical protein